MQFTEPYNSIYQEVIKPVCEEMNLSVYRADEVYKPGIILKDIIGGLLESEVIIADITPQTHAHPNPSLRSGLRIPAYRIRNRGERVV